MKNKIMNRLVNTLSRDLLLDLSDMGVAMTQKAHDIIVNETELKGRRSRVPEGLLRYHMMENAFEGICSSYGASLLQGNVLEGTGLKTYQPFMRFSDADGMGVILGLASMPQKSELPSKNMSRLAGVELNYKISPRLSLDEQDPKPGDIFVLFLVARDPMRAGKVDEIAIGIIDSDYKTYLLYENVEKFMEHYAPSDRELLESANKSIEPLVKLKPKRGAFIPPEQEGNDTIEEETDDKIS